MEEPTKKPLSYTYEGAAEELGIGVTTLRTYVMAGTIPHFRLGERVLFSARALEEWAYESAKNQSSYPTPSGRKDSAA